MNEENFKKYYDLGLLNSKSEKYMWFPDMEFLSYDERNTRKKFLKQSHKIDDMVIFAVNGGGDCWAWDNNDSVYFIEFGSGNCKLYALSFIDAIFRQILEFAAGITIDLCSDSEKNNLSEDDAEYYCSETECKVKIQEFKEAFGNDLSNEEKKKIDDLLNVNLESENALISFEELRKVTSSLLNGKSEELFNILK